MPLTIGIVASQFSPEIINAAVPLTRSSIYTVAVDTSYLISNYGNLAYTYSWQVSSASNPAWTTDTSAGDLTSANFFTRGTVEPINIRPVAKTGRLEIRGTAIQYLKPYSSPLDIPNLQLWLDASDASSITVGTANAVQSWRDKSGNANHAQGSTAVPSYNPTLSAVVFNGANHFLSLAQQIFQGPGYSAFFVFNKQNGTDYTISLGGTTSTSIATLMWYNNYNLYGGNKVASDVSLQWSGSLGKGTLATRRNEKFLFKGNNIPIISPWGSSPVNPAVNRLGRYTTTGTSGVFHKGNMHEYIQTSSMLPDNELQLVDQVLRTKWSVT